MIAKRLLATSLIAGAGVLAAGCGSSAGSRPTPSSPAHLPAAASISCTTAGIQKYLYQRGQLTIATDSPAYWPWFYENKPSNGRGYESAVAYAVAKQMGFRSSQVHWVVEPFDASYAPGPKHFDFDINEISISAARAQAVTFSTGYYQVTQALVALKGSPIVTKHSPAELKNYIFGDQIGTTSLSFINSAIQPSHTPAIFDTLNDVKSALAAHRIDGFVTDTPTAQYIAADEIPGGVLVAQFPSSTEQYGLLFQKGNKLATCVDRAISALKSNGTLSSLQHRYLRLYNKIPTIKP
jgi:polar amino acid transport system substrate-binding protein